MSSIIAASALLLSIYTAWTNQINTVREERAYVSATAANVYNFGNANKLQPYLLITNSGKTLAQISSISAGVSILPSLPNNFDDLGKSETEPGKFAAWPGQPYVMFRTYDVISKDDIQAVLASNKRIFVFGKIQYKDVFGKERQTIFCHMYSGSETADFPNNGGRGYAGFQARYCDKHNSAS